MGWWHHGWGLGGWESMLVGGLMMLLFWGGLFILLFFLVRAVTGAGRGRGEPEGTGEEALAILRRRYAQGDIDAEEFKERQRTLQSDSDLHQRGGR